MRFAGYPIFFCLLSASILAQRVEKRSSLLAGSFLRPLGFKPCTTDRQGMDGGRIGLVTGRTLPVQPRSSIGPLRLPDLRLKPVLPFLVMAGGAYLIANPWARKRLVEQWEIVFSPNHASPENKGPFRFRTMEEEASLPDQCDKWNHLTFSYLPLRPVAAGCQYLLEGIPRWLGGVEASEEETSLRAVIISSMLVSSFGFLEEYIDGFEKDEGFSVQDMVGNLIGVGLGVGKELGCLEGLGVYWTFRGTPETWRYPWWNYMSGYEIRITYDLSPAVFGSNPESGSLNPLQFVGYLPTETVAWSSRPAPYIELDYWWSGRR